jgi:hypothetical protein
MHHQTLDKFTALSVLTDLEIQRLEKPLTHRERNVMALIRQRMVKQWLAEFQQLFEKNQSLEQQNEALYKKAYPCFDLDIPFF